MLIRILIKKPEGFGGAKTLGSQAAKAAQAHDFIQNLPNGYDTQIGDGKLLSGGHGKSCSRYPAILLTSVGEVENCSGAGVICIG